jgi:hypothetical protein
MMVRILPTSRRTETRISTMMAKLLMKLIRITMTLIATVTTKTPVITIT